MPLQTLTQQSDDEDEDENANAVTTQTLTTQTLTDVSSTRNNNESCFTIAIRTSRANGQVFLLLHSERVGVRG